MSEIIKENEVLLDHMNELRMRVIRILVFFMVTLVAVFMYVPEILDFVTLTSKVDVQLNAFNITDPLLLHVKLASIVAVIVTFPYMIFELWMFISPALDREEKKYIYKYIPLVCILFFGGVAFAYFIMMPYYVMFSQKLAGNIDLKLVMGASKYIDFLSGMLLSFGLVFQLPVLVFILSYIGIISSKLLCWIRKYAYFAMLITAAFLTPPDPVSMGITMIPLVLLYELSIRLCKLNEKKKN